MTSQQKVGAASSECLNTNIFGHCLKTGSDIEIATVSVWQNFPYTSSGSDAEVDLVAQQKCEYCYYYYHYQYYNHYTNIKKAI